MCQTDKGISGVIMENKDLKLISAYDEMEIEESEIKVFFFRHKWLV
jgi:hypothetical protein